MSEEETGGRQGPTSSGPETVEALLPTVESLEWGGATLDIE